jgi:hypothetical protein
MSEAFESLARSLAQAPQPLTKEEIEIAVITAQYLTAAAELKVEFDNF